MDYKALANTILKLVGGEDNVNQLTHCATRLRFNLKDSGKAKTEELKNTPGVLGVVAKDSVYQVIIGSDVPNVYRHLSGIGNPEKGEKEEPKGNLGSRLIDTISGIFVPILPPLTAAGMLKALLAILIAAKVIASDSSTYQVINFMADAMFYFMPVMLAASAAKKFNCNAYLAMMLGGILLHPNFVSMVGAAKEAGTMMTVFGLPIYNATYSSSVIPIILSIWFMSKVEPIADRISPNAIKYFTRPLITILVSGIAMLVVLGPVGYIVSQLIASGVNGINSIAGWLMPTLMGAFLPFLVMVGVHHGLTPIGINNRMTIGYDTIIYPGQLASNVAQGAAALAVSVKSKDKELKQLSSATGITAVCGITEPVLFGVTMRIRTNLIAAMLGGGAGGLFLGITGVKNFSGGSPGLLTLPSYIGLDAPMSNFYLAVAGAAIAFAVSFITSFVLYKDKKADDVSEGNNDAKQKKGAVEKEETIYAPMEGKVVLLEDVKDETFANGILGKGVAILPQTGELFAPADGVIVNYADTLHAVGMITDNGAEVLIHIGLDTVTLKGKYFTAIHKNGDRVKKGELLLEFDLKALEQEGFDMTSPVVITNTLNYDEVNISAGKHAAVGNQLIHLKGR